MTGWRKSGLVAVTVAAMVPTVPAGAEVLSDLEVSGILENETALGLTRHTLQASTMTLTPEISFSLSDRTRITLIGRLRGDMKDRLEPGEPQDAARGALSGRLLLGDHIEAELREAYLDTEIGATYLRLGKQQIVWGQADGLKVLDVLNPQSFREFILPEFQDSRIPLWAVNAEVPVGDVTLQLVWIPDTTYDDIPEAGALFELTSPLIVPAAPAGVPVTFAPLDKPSDTFGDSDVGVKLSAFLGGWDLSLNYAYHYVDRPVVRRFATGAGVTVHQTYERSHLIGGTFSNVFGDVTLRGELGYSTNRFFRTDDTQDLDGVMRAGEFAYVVGLDYSGFTDLLLSAQIFQSFLSQDDPGLVRGQVDSSATVLLRRDFMNEALQAEALLIQSLSDGDGVLQLALTYEWRSDTRLKAGADIFYGTREGLFGQFQENDRVTVGVEWSF